MNTEDTIYDSDEATDLDGSTNNRKKEEAASPASEVAAGNSPAKGGWKKVAIGTVTGSVFGAATTVFTSATTATASSDGEDKIDGPDHPADEPVNQHPLVDDSITIADSVDDQMSFSQAFAAARAEVGPGGVFEWHGQLYGTYTAEEWDGMTSEERAEYNDHFAWSSHTGSTDYTADASAATPSPDEVPVVDHETPSHSPLAEEPGQAQEGQPIGEVTPDDEVAVVGHTETEVQVLGVVHDADTDMNIGAMTVDGQEVVLIDVDNDQVFDVMAADLNGDGEFQENEMADISGQQLTVEDLGGILNPHDNLIASSDEIDYIGESEGYEG